MIKNYLLDAVRNIKKSKGYSFVNIAGLSVGFACCILIFMWVNDEISFDRFHENADEIYRVIVKKSMASDTIHTVATPNALGPALENEYPEIIHFTRYYVLREWVVEYGEKRFTNDLIGLGDPSIFDMFTFSFVRGNPQTVFKDFNSVVITERFARKYFGDEDPMNKVLKLTGYDFKVTGIIKDLPNNSHIWFDCIFPFRIAKYFMRQDLNSWGGNMWYYTYIQLQKNAHWKEVEKKISGIVKKHDVESNIDIYLQPLKDIHLKSKFDGDRCNFKQGNINYVYLLSIIGLSILFIACFNYTNLSTARAADRAKGIASRKVNGASRMDIIKQFLGEAIILSLVALIFAVILVYFLLPVFNDLSGKQLTFSLLGSIPFLLGLIAFAVVIGLIAGSYPALYLSSFQPVMILKGSGISPVKGKVFLRKTLVIIQFAIAIVLIVSTTVIYTQLEFVRTKDLGFDYQNVFNFFSAQQIEVNFEEKKAAFMVNPNVLNFTMGGIPMLLWEFETDNVDWEGKDPNERITFFPSQVDYGYIELYKLKIVEGRSFSKEFSTDTSAFIVNETAVKRMGFKSPLGKRLRINDREGAIIGVVKDYHHRSLHSKIIPVVLMVPYTHGMVSVRIHPKNVGETLRFLENTWNKINRGPFPFIGSFADETIDNLYKSERKIGTIAQVATLITLFVSCLGLFGLASYTSRQRIKEIGIRKVFGSSVPGIVWLISKDFLRWIILALIIAFPLAWYAMNRWLQSFAYRTGIEWWMFVSAGVAALAIGFFTVSYQAIRAARTNPIDTLRYE